MTQALYVSVLTDGTYTKERSFIPPRQIYTQCGWDVMGFEKGGREIDIAIGLLSFFFFLYCSRMQKHNYESIISLYVCRAQTQSISRHQYKHISAHAQRPTLNEFSNCGMERLPCFLFPMLFSVLTVYVSREGGVLGN